ncbi:MAG: hypothetical protein Q9202_004148 [Teloschistes flavicans]
MPSLPRSLLSLAFLATILATASGRIEIRAGCSENYSKCSPKGATSADTPALGPDLSPLYTDLVNSVQGVKKSKRDQVAALLQPRASSNLCCQDGTQCLLLQGLDLPFCYDNYTTNYFLPGGSTGQIVSGDYQSPTEGTANLISGDFTKSDGTKGNVYGSEDSPSKPNTAALPIPTQYTASGSISAIPATALGQVATITTTIPGTTIAPSVVAAQTLPPRVDGTSTVGSSTVKAASTIPGTTVAAKTSVYTTTLANPSPTGSKGAGAATVPNMSGAAGFGFLLYAIFGL